MYMYMYTCITIRILLITSINTTNSINGNSSDNTSVLHIPIIMLSISMLRVTIL